MKKILIFIFMILLSGIIVAQNEVDAFRFSEIYYSGTSRSMGMANAFGALGADLSTASTNPAGIGIFRHSEFSFTPTFMMSKTDANFNGTVSSNDKASFFFNSFSGVFSFYEPDKDIRAVNFSFGYNRTNNFGHNYYIKGVNDKGSMLDAFLNDAQGKTPNELNSFTSFLAWDTYLLDTTTDATHYTNALWWTQNPGDSPKYGETQTRIQNVKGGSGEYFINAAINYKDFVYFGATVGFQKFQYTYVTEYSEENFEDNSDLKSFTYTENLYDIGNGINFKAGFIIKPVSFFRLGASIHSPTYYTITDKFNTSLSSYWNSPDPNGNYDYTSSTEQNTYRYHLLTPLRVMADAAYVIGKYGAIDFSYEYVDYSSMRLSGDDYLFTDENAAIRDKFVATNNYRLGGELRLDIFRFRAGYALFGNPYNNSTTKMDFAKSQMSAGFGIKLKGFYCDLAYIRDLQNFNQYLYNGYQDEPVPKISQNDGLISLTLGFTL